MESQPLISNTMLAVDFKTSKATNFNDPISKYIASHYEDDPAKYSEGISTLGKLRQDCLDSCKSFSSNGNAERDKILIISDYANLELLELNFPIDESKCAIYFYWTEAFKNDVGMEQCSLAFEKAAVIFNLGALMACTAAKQDRSVDTGMKLAFNHFQCAAGVFQYIAENFLHAPSIDMSKECVDFMSQVMLAQAQECFLNKIILEAKKPAMISKVATQASSMYVKALDAYSVSEEIKGYFPSTWPVVIKLKSDYMNAISQYYKSIVCETEGNYGEQVSRLTLAESLAKDCVKKAKELSGFSPSAFLNSYFSSDSSKMVNGSNKPEEMSLPAAISEMCKNLLAFITPKKNSAVKDNDVIYCQPTPAISALEVLPTAPSMATALRLTQLYPTLTTLVTEGLFSGLVSMDVHEKNSLYFSQKEEKIINVIKREVNDCDAESTARLSSLGLPASFHRLKQVLQNENGTGAHLEVPKDVREWNQWVNGEERVSQETILAEKWVSASKQCRNILDDIKGPYVTLDSSIRKWGSELSALGVAVDQIYSSRQKERTDMMANWKKTLEKYEETFAQGANGDSKLNEKRALNRPGMDLLKYSVGKEFEKEFANAIMSELDPSLSKVQKGGSNLLDLDIPQPKEQLKSQSNLELVKQIEVLLTSITAVKNERDVLFNELKKKVQDDDIHQLLVLNSTKQDEVIKVELEKFIPFQFKIRENIGSQTKLIDQVVLAFEALKKSNLGKESDRIVSVRGEVLARLQDARFAYEEIKKNMKEGVDFYTRLGGYASELLNRFNEATIELQKDQNEWASKRSRSEQVLQDKVAKMTLNSPTTPKLNQNFAQSYSAPYQPMAPPVNQQNQFQPISYPSANQFQQQPTTQQQYTPPIQNYQAHGASANYQQPNQLPPTAFRPQGVPVGLPSHLGQPLSYAPSVPPVSNNVPLYGQYGSQNYNPPANNFHPETSSANYNGYNAVQTGIPTNYIGQPPPPGQFNPYVMQNPQNPPSNQSGYRPQGSYQ